jgi:nitric oxide reductase NorD protein
MTRYLDSASIRLPVRATRRWYRVALAHRALRDAAGTSDVGGDDLARECFELFEGYRVDERIARDFGGLAADLRSVQSAELTRRPPLVGTSFRTSALELLARLSLTWRGVVPDGLTEIGAEMLRLIGRLGSRNATVRDSAALGIQTAALIRRHPADGGDQRLASPEHSRPMLALRAAIVYREGPDEPVGVRSGDPDDPRSFDESLRARIGGALAGAPDSSADGRGFADHRPEATVAGSVASDTADQLVIGGESGAFVYPEWDYMARAYRRAWTIVRESVPRGTPSGPAAPITIANRRLAREIRRQFESMAPETLRRVRGASDGEDLDLDAALDALADLRAGVPPSERLYTRRERAQRDVAVIFLVDLSSSTQESVRVGGQYRRVIDVEREALKLLIEPLVQLGDSFGMYGFSGTGRADVQFVVIKRIAESVSAACMDRLEGIRPMHTTRLGAAIRHAATKFGGISVGTRLMVVISDGRPFDVDYGQQYGVGSETEYAISDTRAALDEARNQGIRPFILTIDSSGGDYLRRICSDLDYEVLADVSELPLRLARLYNRLTGQARVA